MGDTKKPYIMGIDPGIHGALACIDPRMNQVVALNDVPVVPDGPNGRNIVDTATLSLQLHVLSNDIEFCMIEDVHSMPRDGHVGAFSFGKTTGILIGMVSALLIPIHYVPPAVWKGCFGLGRDKNESREMATKRYPHSSHLWKRKKDSDRAEAVLIADFGRRFY